ncbi:hypothetical protein BDV93DRAFT_596755 [Ceratobasidium sp. AG-I]|nr:hypothetical protein BDV93DRAFT_596755 [Ceratobasidium sp. AG-I]
MDKIWHRPSKIVLGFDIGTTCSAVSIIHLMQGCKPQIQRVTKWPGQGDSQGNCRLPSWIWYDGYNRAVKLGAEALNQPAADADARGWQLVKYFKLHLHPSDMAPTSGFKLEALPRGVSISQIYTDLFRYLYSHTKLFFEEHNLDGGRTWQSLSNTMELVVAHPNGWGSREQGVLRSAAVQAGLSSQGSAHERIIFVPEAEASLQYCLSLTQASSLSIGTNIVICDAGGSTVDTTVYNVTKNNPMLKLNEVKSSACIQAGSIFVDDEASSYINRLISRANSSGDSVDIDTEEALHDFSRYVKPSFNGTEDSLSLKVGNRRLNRSQMGISGGRMKLTGTVVKSFFDACVIPILASVATQANGVNSPYYFLVGGFGDSPYLKSALKSRLNVSGRLITNNDPSAKAVADGAAIWSVARSVDARATRYSYGIQVLVTRDKNDAEHLARPAVIQASGVENTSHGWSEIVPQNKVMQSDSSIKSSYYREYSTATPHLPKLEVILYSTYHPATTQFMRDRQGNLYKGFDQVCTVTADLQTLHGLLERKYSNITGVYWKQDFQVCIRFGGTELSAYLEWVQNGKTMTGPATVIPMALS